MIFDIADPTLFTKAPTAFGVYLFYDELGTVIYVGQSSNVRSRLRQHFSKKSKKSSTIVASAKSVQWYSCKDSDTTLKLEIRLIQTLRPQFNVEAKFTQFYRTISIYSDQKNVTYFCLSSTPETLPQGFEHFGAYRSKELTYQSYQALMRLIYSVGTKLNTKVPFAHGNLKVASVAKLSQSMLNELKKALSGDRHQFLTLAFEALVEKPDARQIASKVAEDLKTLRLFFNSECRKLKKLRSRNDIEGHIKATDRDLLKFNYNPRD
jgi:predicted GIY-YIG superfamily endonuclease